MLGCPPPVHTSDRAMADTVMDFLFASQDASTASLVWVTCLMAEHPEVLAKVSSAARQATDPSTWFAQPAFFLSVCKPCGEVPAKVSLLTLQAYSFCWMDESHARLV